MFVLTRRTWCKVEDIWIENGWNFVEKGYLKRRKIEEDYKEDQSNMTRCSNVEFKEDEEGTWMRLFLRLLNVEGFRLFPFDRLQLNKTN